MHLGDTNQVGEPPHLAFPVARDEHHAGELVDGAQVADERPAVRPRGVAEPEECRDGAVDHENALEPAGGWRERGGADRVDGGTFLSASDHDLVQAAAAVEVPHAAGEPLPRLLGEFLDLHQPQALLGGRRGDGRGERVL